MWKDNLERGQSCCLASGVLPDTHSISSHFTHFPYETGTFPAVTLFLNPKVGGFTDVLSWVGTLNGLSWETGSFFWCPNPHWFLTTRSYGALFSWYWNPGLCSLAWGWDHLLLRHPSQFLSTKRECGTTHPLLLLQHLHTTQHLLVSLPQLLTSTPPSHLDECGFFKSLVVGLPYNVIFWQFWVLSVLRLVVILLVVVQGGEACLLCLQLDWKLCGTLWYYSFEI